MRYRSMQLAHSFLCSTSSSTASRRVQLIQVGRGCSLHAQKGFTEADGWKHGYWKRTVGGKEYNLQYLLHRDGHLIASQHRAWNDTPRFAMYIDLVLKPISIARGGLAMWMDNCSVHKVEALEAFFEEANIQMLWLPPNMTAILQVIDLVVNGPIKANIRRLRCDRLVLYFDGFKRAYYRGLRKLPPVHVRFKAPKPLMRECILDILEWMKVQNESSTMKSNIQASFIKTGCCYEERTDEDGVAKQEFREFAWHDHNYSKTRKRRRVAPTVAEQLVDEADRVAEEEMMN